MVMWSRAKYIIIDNKRKAKNNKGEEEMQCRQANC